MNKKKYIILCFIIILSVLLGVILGLNSEDKEELANEEIVKSAIEEAFIKSIYENKEGQISNVRLACQSNMRYLYVFEYDFWNNIMNKQDKDNWAIEMIIDEKNEFYYIQNLERYYNRFDDKCINLYE